MVFILFSFFDCKLCVNKVRDLMFIFEQLEKVVCMYEKEGKWGKPSRKLKQRRNE